MPAADEDKATAALHELGTSGIEVRGEPGSPVLVAYFPARDGLSHELGRALPGARIRPLPVPEGDWLARYREGFRAFEAAGFVLAPPWARPAPPAPRLLVVEPGPAFGTGTHETTQLCLRALAERAAEGGGLGRVLDVGTGSGILALAALRCGARWALGVDIDPVALEWARRQARLNDLDLSLVRGDAGTAVRPGRFDLVLANLTAPLLCALASDLSRLVSPAGLLVLSGFLREESASVGAAYAARGPARRLEQNDWAALVVEVLA